MKIPAERFQPTEPGGEIDQPLGKGLFTVADLCLHPEIWILDMSRRMLNDRQWLRIADLLPGKPTDKGGRAADNRRFVEAVLFIARMGCPWRDLPADFGNWHSIYVRFARWEKGGVWARVAEALSDGADLEEREEPGVFQKAKAFYNFLEKENFFLKNWLTNRINARPFIIHFQLNVHRNFGGPFRMINL